MSPALGAASTSAPCPATASRTTAIWRSADATRDRLDAVVDRDLKVDAETRPPVAVLRTGQELGYRGTEGEIGEGNGDDGDLRPGEEHEYTWSDDGVIDTAAENIVMDRVTGREPLPNS